MTTGRASQALRSALHGFLAGEAQARLLSFRDPSGVAPSEQRGQGAWLLSESGQEALADALGDGELSPDEERMLKQHMASIRHALLASDADENTRLLLTRASLSSGDALALPERLARIARADDAAWRVASARALDEALLPIAFSHVKAHARAEVRSKNERDLPKEPWQAIGTAFLADTKDAAEEGLRYALRNLGKTQRIDWTTLLRALRAPELDSPSGARERWRRACAWLRALGFERELDGQVRAEVLRGAALPVVAHALIDPPRGIRIAQSGIDYGVVSDALAAEGVAHALGFALALPGMPVELRWPVGAGPAGTLGALALQLWGEREHLRWVQGLSEREAERVGRVAGTLALLRTRAWVAVGILSIDVDERLDARCEVTAQALGHALCCEISPAMAGLLGANRVAARERAQEALAGLTLHVALRERFDQDWFRNPRSAEGLRNACGRGSLLSPEAWCEELGTTLSLASKRAAELVK